MIIKAADTFVFPLDAPALLAARDFDHLPGSAATVIFHIDNMIIGQRAIRRHFFQHLVLTALLTSCNDQCNKKDD